MAQSSTAWSPFFRDVTALFSKTVGRNAPEDFLTALAIFIGIAVILRLLILFFARRLRNHPQSKTDAALARFMEDVGPAVYIAVALYIATRNLILPQMLHQAIGAAFMIALVFQSVRVIQRLLNFIIRRAWMRKDEDAQHVAAMFVLALSIMLWSLAVVLILANLGVNVTSLLAGLGIGGVAVALAVQNILGDIFSSFSLYLDRPFKIGDFIIVGDNMGTVRKIGLKTTRIAALQGQEIIISNKDLTASIVQNHKRMQTRRIEFSVVVDMVTPLEKLEKIPAMLRSIIEPLTLVTVDRIHFKNFAEFGLRFEVVYFVQTADFNTYMDIQQTINYGILRDFEREDIHIATPLSVLDALKKK